MKPIIWPLFVLHQYVWHLLNLHKYLSEYLIQNCLRWWFLPSWWRFLTYLEQFLWLSTTKESTKLLDSYFSPNIIIIYIQWYFLSDFIRKIQFRFLICYMWRQLYSFMIQPLLSNVFCWQPFTTNETCQHGGG